jgi:amino acid transporter
MSGAGAPGVYVVSTLAYLLFAGGYIAMSRRLSTASGLIAFIAAGFGRRAGVAAAYMSLLTFPLFLGALYGIFSMFFQHMVADLTGVTIHWALIATVAVLVTTLVSYSRLEVSVRLLSVMLFVGVAVVLVLDVVVIADSVPTGGLPLEPFAPQSIFGPAVGLAMLFAVGAYGGLESTAVYAEEVRRPRVTIARGLYLSVILIGAFYVLSTWAITASIGTDHVQETAVADPTGFIFAVAGTTLGSVWMHVLNIIVVISFHGILVGFTNICARYTFALGRAGLLPERLGTSHPKHQSPHLATLVTGAAILVLVAIFALTGGDPFGHMYTWLIAESTIGSILLIVLSSAATVAFHVRTKHQERAWNAYIAPVLSTIVFSVVIWLAVTNFELLAGSAPAAKWLWVLVPAAGIVGWTVGGARKYQKLAFDPLG